MKKNFIILGFAFVLMLGLAACDAKASGYENGVYFAQEESYKEYGWKDFAIVTIQKNKVTDSYWSGINIKNYMPEHRIASQNGEYGMFESGNAVAPWYKQAEAVENWLVENQDLNLIEYENERGVAKNIKIDETVSATMSVTTYVNLVEKALDSAFVEKGQYELADGVYTAKSNYRDTNITYFGTFIVVNGRIVDVNFNAYSEAMLDGDGEFITRDELKEAYGMTLQENVLMEWYEQVDLLEAEILEHQVFNVNYIDEEGHVDSIAGVTIHIDEFEKIFNEVFSNAE